MGDRRRWLRQPLAVATSVLALGGAVGVGAAALLDAGHDPHPLVPRAVTEAPTPTGAPSPTAAPSSASSPSPAAPDARIRSISWASAKITLPALAGCPARRVAFHGGRFSTGATDEAWIWEIGGLGPNGKPVYGDIDGDGAEEALVVLRCSHHYSLSADVIAFRLTAAGPAAMGTVVRTSPNDQEWPDSAVVHDGIVSVVVKAGDGADRPVTETKTMRWRGGKFVRADASVAILEVHLDGLVYRLPRMAGCPSHTGAVPGEIGRPGTPGHFAWSWANAGAEQSEPAYGDLDGDGVSEMLITIDCIGYFPATRGEGGVGVTVAALKLDRTGQPTVLGYLGTGEWRVVQRLAVHNGVATVTFTSRDNNRSVVDYRWTGVKFTRS